MCLWDREEDANEVNTKSRKKAWENPYYGKHLSVAIVSIT